MDYEKQAGSETSSDKETSRSLSPDHGSKDGLGRSYECTFCKRGFTNAQALGGHMNIHRKDKAKAKQHNYPSSTKPNKDHWKDSFNLVPNEKIQYQHGASFGFRTGDHEHYPIRPSNPNFPWNLSTPSQFDYHAPRNDHLRVNLNLGIGTSEMESSDIRGANVGQDDWLENEVDLELRLGYNP